MIEQRSFYTTEMIQYDKFVEFTITTTKVEPNVMSDKLTR